jgi:nicotinamidase/pyrazinamidase
VVTYDAATALVVTDVQNDFADPAGSLYVSGGDDVVAFANEQICAARRAGALVLYTQDWHPEHTPHFQRDGGVWPVHCVRGTWGAEFHPALEVAGDVVRKGAGGEDGYSGFTVRDPRTGREEGTGMEDLLRSRGAERVIVLGLATDYCVKETVLDARRKGFEAVVLVDGVRAVDLQRGDGEDALRSMAEAGATLT